MPANDQDGILARLRALLPASWFPESAPVRDGLLAGFATVAAFNYAQIDFARLQTRVATASGAFLDLIALDFLGRRVQRKKDESDDALRARVIAEVLRLRATREGLRKALVDLTGREPWIFEPANPYDTGAYSTNTIGYGRAGGYGSLLLPYQVFVKAYRPSSSGIPYVAGYSAPAGGYGVASRASYADLAEIIGPVTDDDIYDAITGVKAAGITIWTRLSSERPSTAGLDFSDGDNSQYLPTELV